MYADNKKSKPKFSKISEKESTTSLMALIPQ